MPWAFKIKNRKEIFIMAVTMEYEKDVKVAALDGKKIAIIGKTPYIKGQMRGYEIEKWITLHSNLIHLNKFLIFDDDADMVHPELMDRLVQTRLGAGFMEEEFVAAIEKHRTMRKWSGFAPRPEQLTIWTVPLLTDEYEEAKDLTRTEKTVIIVA